LEMPWEEERAAKGADAATRSRGSQEFLGMSLVCKM
jgi:hypothetical protein